MAQLIITGDDFGLSPQINQAIILAHQRGVLSSAALLINGPASEEAIALAKAHPTLSVGLHIALVQGRASLSPREIPDLVDQEGNFPASPVIAGIKYFFHRSLRAQLEREIEAQLERFLAKGLTPSHLSGHLNLHMHPSVFPLILKILDAYDIKALRIPREPLWLNLSLNRHRWTSKIIHYLIFRLLARRGLALLKGRNISYPRYAFGLLQSGGMDVGYLKGIIENLPPGPVEIYLHLSTGSEWPQNPNYRPHRELEALLSPIFSQALRDRDVELIGYDRLRGTHP